MKPTGPKKYRLRGSCLGRGDVLERAVVLVTKIIVLGAIVVASVAYPQGELFLDLTTPAVAQVEGSQTHGCGGGMGTAASQGHVSVPPALWLTLEIVSLGATKYRVGDELNAGLQLTNTGRQPLSLPWSVATGFVFDNHCRWVVRHGVKGLHGNITLVLEDGKGYKGFIAGHDLFGVSNDKSTYRVLEPGKSALIKTAGKVILCQTPTKTYEATVPTTSPASLTVTARYTLDDTPAFGAYRPVTSTNRFEITVER